MLDRFHLCPSERISLFRDQLIVQDLDAFVLPRFDAHQGEYVAPHDERLAYLTGFTGSAGLAFVTPEIVALFVDGRYSLQAAQECKGALFSHHHLHGETPEKWLRKEMRIGWRLGFDPMHIPPSWFDRFDAACKEVGATMVPQQVNPVDAVWTDQPAPPCGRVTVLPSQIAGKNCTEKCTSLANYLVERQADFVVETQPDNIAWLLNIRGADVNYNPVVNSFLLAHRDGALVWFVDPKKLDDFVEGVLPSNLQIVPQAEFLPTLKASFKPGQFVLADPDFSPVAVRQTIEEAGAKFGSERSVITLTKALKNTIELEGLRTCHFIDGIAWAEFGAWLADTVPVRAESSDPLTEREAEQKLRALRCAQQGFLDDSFHAISAAGVNAAMCHYSATADRNDPIRPDQTYLMDSGGQYETGTTDTTRCYAFGSRPEGYDEAYTAVFKAFYALATLRFPPGTQGHHIDGICRRPLWDLGLDYDHGTGHGIGHRLSVHEHPQRIGKPYNPIDLEPGMVMSIEPGFYKAASFGIRIENVFEVVTEDNGFLAFRNMTFVPIQTDMLIVENLTQAERHWLNQYHRQIRQMLSPRLSEPAKGWLTKVTTAI